MAVRHSIVVVTYRQEALIGGCLESILSQSVRPYEVIVMDDCSPDGTWSVIQRYVEQYPDLIRAIRNPSNLGVFGNFNEGIKYPTGDLVCCVAGDDLLPEGILEKYDRFIEQNSLNCADSFVIYTNSLALYPNGRTVLHNNKAVFRQDMFMVGVEQCMWSWDTGMSRGLLDRIRGEGIRTDLGYQADLLWHLNKAAQSDKSYFLDAVGYIYRVGVGVSVSTRHIEHLESKRRVVAEIYRRFPERITPKVRRFYRFDDAWMVYNAYPNMKNYLHYLREYFAYGRFPKGNIHHCAWKVLPPIWAKRLVRKLLNR